MATTKRHVMNAAAFAVFVSALKEGATVQGLCDKTGLHINTVRKYINALRNLDLCHVSEWISDLRGRYCTPVHKLGDEDDAEKPLSQKAALRLRQEYREKFPSLARVWRSTGVAS